MTEETNVFITARSFSSSFSGGNPEPPQNLPAEHPATASHVWTLQGNSTAGPPCAWSKRTHFLIRDEISLELMSE